MSKEPIQTPRQSKIFLFLGVFFLLLPSALNLYKGETGRLIVGSGKLSDPNFAEGVVYIIHHSWDRALGIIVNRPVPAADLKKIPAFLQDKNLPLYYGGPVMYPDEIVVLEKGKDKEGKEVITLRKYDEAVSEDPEYLSKIISSVKEGKDNYRIYLGYAGWGVLQLDREFGRGDWASTSLNTDWVFYKDMTPRDAWIKALEAATNKRKPRNPGVI